MITMSLSVKSSTDSTLPWTDLPKGAISPGVYRLRGRTRPGSLLETVAAWGWRPIYLDGKQIVDKPTFLAAAHDAFAFPGYAGRNWDAFEELIRDLGWMRAPGYVVIYDHVHHFAGRHPAQWQTALDIFQHAAAEWQTNRVPFFVLLRQPWWTNRHLPVLAEPEREGTL
jgi:RNAse (barnase) inhibitor barstar